MSGYLGVQPVPQATQHRQTITASAGLTSITTTGYQPGYVDVYLNGVKLLDGLDYTATDGASITLAIAAAAGDTVEVIANVPFQLVGMSFSGTTSFTGQINLPTWTTATRPSNPSVGTTGFNTTLGYQETWGGSGWTSLGKGIVQVVHFPMPYSWAGTSVNDGTGCFTDSPLVASITPQKVSNKILIATNIYLGHSTTNSGYLQHFRIKKTVNGVVSYPIIGNNESNRPRVSGSVNLYGLNTYNVMMMSGVHIDSPATTSEVSYVIQVGGYSGSPVIYINRSETYQAGPDYDSLGVSTLTLMEIAV